MREPRVPRRGPEAVVLRALDTAPAVIGAELAQILVAMSDIIRVFSYFSPYVYHQLLWS